MKTLHVVGFKNSGKTTLVSRWVRLLKEKGLKVAVLKHHGHGGKPEMPDAGTDTMKFLTDGADATLVAGGGAVQLIWNEEPDFETLKRMVSYRKPDVLLIEGYKSEFGDKVMLLRDRDDWDQLRNLQGKQLVIGCPDINIVWSHIHSREETELIDKWFLEWIGEGDGNEAF
ncbi:molybdopterin-guanine dinucleotide biosynthesis protein B [Sporosarcina sp. FSL W8-0480]|uniref:molybdopterin-guanine dinucleotide biosynthesis protein B n=1 Tax=Sporosarcina sp. FSL W8-0480 TaxID=2954701 RepID=UPI0030DAE26C